METFLSMMLTCDLGVKWPTELRMTVQDEITDTTELKVSFEKKKKKKTELEGSSKNRRAVYQKSKQ